MTTRVERHHWLATYCGILDGAFYLSEEELFAVSDIIKKLLILLKIPGRSTPETLPLPLVQEVNGKFYTIALETRDFSRVRVIRHVTPLDCAASLEAWREALVALISSTYPDLTPDERLITTTVFTDLLAAIGVPNRAAAFHPNSVLAAYREIDTPDG